MPRKPTYESKIRLLRESIGKTQDHFAAMLGVSTISIKRIESGKLRLSHAMKVRIRIATGVSSYDTETGELLFMNSTPFTKELFDDYQRKSRTRQPGETTAKVKTRHQNSIAAASKKIIALMEAAAYHNRLDTVSFQFEEWLYEILAEHKLVAQFLKSVDKLDMDEFHICELGNIAGRRALEEQKHKAGELHSANQKLVIAYRREAKEARFLIDRYAVKLRRDAPRKPAGARN